MLVPGFALPRQCGEYPAHTAPLLIHRARHRPQNPLKTAPVQQTVQSQVQGRRIADERERTRYDTDTSPEVLLSQPI